MGVFEYFREHFGDRPYQCYPSCCGELRTFRYSRSPGEIVFCCPGCDWSASVTDVDEARDVPLTALCAISTETHLWRCGWGFGLAENMADL